MIWNGFLESIKIAAMAEAYEVNVAPHNYYGHLCSAVSAHFCAVVPNFRVMEIDIDSVAWRDELFINAPVVENGELIVPDRPGWGVEVNEAAVGRTRQKEHDDSKRPTISWASATPSSMLSPERMTASCRVTTCTRAR